AERRIVLVRRQYQRRATAPTAHQLRGDQLLLLRRLPVLPQKVTKRTHVLLQPAIGHVAAVAGEDPRLREIGRRPVLVGVTHDELAGLERRAGAGRWHITRSLDDGLREPVAVAEVV